MVIVRGVNVYPSAIDQMLRSLPGVAEYRVEISERRGMTELTVHVEPGPDVGNPAALELEVADAFRESYSLRVPIEMVEQGALPRFELKAQRWVRREAGLPA